jgi:hypothetical protein
MAGYAPGGFRNLVSPLWPVVVLYPTRITRLQSYCLGSAWGNTCVGDRDIQFFTYDVEAQLGVSRVLNAKTEFIRRTGLNRVMVNEKKPYMQNSRDIGERWYDAGSSSISKRESEIEVSGWKKGKIEGDAPIPPTTASIPGAIPTDLHPIVSPLERCST